MMSIEFVTLLRGRKWQFGDDLHILQLLTLCDPGRVLWRGIFPPPHLVNVGGCKLK